MAWVRMPLRFLSMYAGNIGVLQAEERLGSYTVAALGGGNLQREAAEDILFSWREAAGSGSPSSEPPSREHFEAQMAALGIEVRRDDDAG